MIGRVQDMAAAAVVISSASQSANAAAETQQPNADSEQAEELSAPQTLEEVQTANEANTNAQGSEDDKKKDEEKMDEKSVSYMTEELNKLMSRINCNLSFKYHKEVDMLSVRMLDKKTNEVLKEMPPEAMIEHMIKAKDWIGAFLDKNA